MEVAEVEKKLKNWKNIKFYFPYKELTGVPKWQTVVLTCMDCRITSNVFGVEDPGELTIIRNAGALLTRDSLRSLLIAIYELNVRNIFVCGHTNCGGQMSPQRMDITVEKISKRTNSTPQKVLELLGARNASQAFLGFENVSLQVKKTVFNIKNHPLILPVGVQVSGFVYRTLSGEFVKIL
ncbi:MAG: carbonic anhydrase [Candidatus Hodarchaeales archaeon]|jgi:carbonic anhydrase